MMIAKIAIRTTDVGIEKAVSKAIFDQFVDAVQHLPVGEDVAAYLFETDTPVERADVTEKPNHLSDDSPVFPCFENQKSQEISFSKSEIPLFYKYFAALSNIQNIFHYKTGMEIYREIKNGCNDEHPICFWCIRFDSGFLITPELVEYNLKNSIEDCGEIDLWIDKGF
jgi:hypothetical protein